MPDPAAWDLELVGRTPQAAAPPTRSVVGSLTKADSLEVTRELKGPGVIRLTVAPRTLTDAVKDRLRTLDQAPCEVAVYRDGTLYGAGPVYGYNSTRDAITLHCAGYAGLLAYMAVGPDTGTLIYTTVDQHLIAAGLIDAWQALTWGDYGIDTSTVVASGVTRDRTYLETEPADLLHLITLLSEVNLGFDWDVHPDRRLEAWFPWRGTDLSATVIFDQRAIVAPAEDVSVAPGDLASNAYAVGVDRAGEAAVESAGNTTVRDAFGRAAVYGAYRVTGSAALTLKALRLVAARADQLVSGGVTLSPTFGLTPHDDFGLGDTVRYEYDAGLGLRTMNRRVASITTTVDQQRAETHTVGFV